MNGQPFLYRYSLPLLNNEALALSVVISGYNYVINSCLDMRWQFQGLCRETSLVVEIFPIDQLAGCIDDLQVIAALLNT